jgi:predicted dehydrogenase
MTMNRRDFLRSGGATLALIAGDRALGATAPRGTIRIAQIGTAHSHGPAKWKTFVRHPQLYTPVGIWEPDAAERAKAMKHPDYAGARWLEERELFGDRTIEAAAVETELPDALRMSRRVIDAGWHLHLDKPAGRNLREFAELQEAAARGRRVLQTGYMYRHHPAFRFCFDAVRSGIIGRVVSFDGDMSSEMSLERRPGLAKEYGGSMLLLGCHLVDIALAVMGEPEKVHVHRRRTRPEDNYSDSEIAVMDYPHGHALVRIVNCQIGGSARRQMVVCGENGTIEILPLEPAKVRLTLKQPAGKFVAGAQEVDLPAVTGRYDEMMADFARTIRGGQSAVPQFDARHEMLLQRIVMQFDQA